MKNTRKNKEFNPNKCGVTHFLNRIVGKWKDFIVHAVSTNRNSFSLLQSGILDISKQMLVNLLRELEENRIFERIIYAEIPSKVEYKITDYGISLMPVISVIQEWSLKDSKK